MTTEFRIDRPGVYRRRDGENICVWPAFSKKWVRVAAVSTGKNADGWSWYPMAYEDDGCYLGSGSISEYDIVAYVGPLPADILQRIEEALALAEQQISGRV